MNTIVVEASVNNSKPSIKRQDGRYETVKCIAICVRDGLTVEDAMEEFNLTKVDVLTCVEYVRRYPEVLL